MLLHVPRQLLGRRAVCLYDNFPGWALERAEIDVEFALSLYCFARRAMHFIALPTLSLSWEMAWELTRTCLWGISEWFYASAHIDATSNKDIQLYCKEILCTQLLHGLLENTDGADDPYKVECVESWATASPSSLSTSPPLETNCLPPYGTVAEEAVVRIFPLFNRCAHCSNSHPHKCMVRVGTELGGCSHEDLRYRCEPRAAVHLCNRHACRILLPRTEKSCNKHFLLRDGRVIRQLGWLRKQRSYNPDKKFCFGLTLCPKKSALLNSPEEEVERLSEEQMCKDSLGISLEVLKPRYPAHYTAYWDAYLTPHNSFPPLIKIQVLFSIQEQFLQTTQQQLPT